MGDDFNSLAAACDAWMREHLDHAAEAAEAAEQARLQREALEQQPSQSNPQD